MKANNFFFQIIGLSILPGVFFYENEEDWLFKVNINNPPGILIWYQEPEYGSLQKDHNKTR
jgi:hypothetical protein